MTGKPYAVAHISIGNSDNKLSQADWAAFCIEVGQAVQAAVEHGAKVHINGYSPCSSMWQNAIWAVELPNPTIGQYLRMALRYLADEFGQDSIAWSEAPETIMLEPAPRPADKPLP